MKRILPALISMAPCWILLAMAPSAHGAILTVGTDGAYASVQAALNAAVAMPGDDEIRVRSGIYPENLFVDLEGSGDRIELSGGWDATFMSASDERTTVIDGGGLGKVIEIQTEGADRFVMHGMELANGEDALRVGVNVTAREDSMVELFNLTIRDNLALDDRASAAGLFANLLDAASLQISNCDFLNNTVTSTGTVDGRGGGLTIQLSNSSTAMVSDSRFRTNVVTVAGSGAGVGAGADITQFDPGTAIVMIDNEFR